MRKGIRVLVCAVLVGTMGLTGCSSREDVKNVAGIPAAAVLRSPMVAVVRQQEEMLKRLEAGNVTAARAAYTALALAFGEVLGPISMQEPGLAQEMANASTALRELLNQKQPDRAQVRRQAEILRSAVHRAAEGIGISLTGTAAAQASQPKSDGVAVAKAVTIEVRARNYRFVPPVITVDKGTRVTIKLINEGTEKHEFELDTFGFEIRPIAPRSSAQGSFLADRTGRFEFACHVDGHYEKGMKGVLVVQ